MSRRWLEIEYHVDPQADGLDTPRHRRQARAPHLVPPAPHIPLVPRVWRPARGRIGAPGTGHLGRLFRQEARGARIGACYCEKGDGSGK